MNISRTIQVAGGAFLVMLGISTDVRASCPSQLINKVSGRTEAAISQSVAQWTNLQVRDTFVRNGGTLSAIGGSTTQFSNIDIAKGIQVGPPPNQRSDVCEVSFTLKSAVDGYLGMRGFYDEDAFHANFIPFALKAAQDIYDLAAASQGKAISKLPAEIKVTVDNSTPGTLNIMMFNPAGNPSFQVTKINTYDCANVFGATCGSLGTGFFIPPGGRVARQVQSVDSHRHMQFNYEWAGNFTDANHTAGYGRGGAHTNN